MLQMEKKNFLGKIKLETPCMQRIQCRPSSCNRNGLQSRIHEFPMIQNPGSSIMAWTYKEIEQTRKFMGWQQIVLN